MDERARRIGENEALFRRLNEEVEGVNRSFASITRTMDLVCECGDLACLERFVVPIELYERVRGDARRFFVLPGHVADDVEEVVERLDGYVVVQKRPGVPADVAERTDPRST
jgi:hypothetical protein